MLMNNPAQFQKVAREWAIKHAGAPKTTSWIPTASVSTPLKQKTQKLSREEEARQQALRLDSFNRLTSDSANEWVQ
jgi:ubiquitin-conjugating enzyme (huntingtin interacting protein 2)